MYNLIFDPPTAREGRANLAPFAIMLDLSFGTTRELECTADDTRTLCCRLMLAVSDISFVAQACSYLRTEGAAGGERSIIGKLAAQYKHDPSYMLALVLDHSALVNSEWLYDTKDNYATLAAAWNTLRQRSYGGEWPHTTAEAVRGVDDECTVDSAHDRIVYPVDGGARWRPYGPALPHPIAAATVDAFHEDGSYVEDFFTRVPEAAVLVRTDAVQSGMEGGGPLFVLPSTPDALARYLKRPPA